MAISLVTKTNYSLVYNRFIGCLFQCLVQYTESSTAFERQRSLGWERVEVFTAIAMEMGCISTGGQRES